MLETRLIREVRARQEAAAQDELTELIAELVAEMFPELLMASLKQPAVRTALCNIIAAARRESPSPPAARRSAARGVRRA